MSGMAWRKSWRYLTNAWFSKIHGEVPEGEYDSGGTKSGRTEIPSALKQGLLCSYNVGNECCRNM